MKYIFLAITYFYSSYIIEKEIIKLKRPYLCYIVVLLRAEAVKKSIHKLKAEFVYLILWEEKISSLEITVIIFKVFKKCKSLIQREF